MAARNADSMTNAQGEFHASKPRSEPMTTSGHQVGQRTGNDAVPEFHAKTLPPGTAPASSTFKPNPVNETPGQALNDDVDRSHGKENVGTSAMDTIGGATSADVHTGLGKPIQGQSSIELRHDSSHKTSGTEGTGATGGSGLHGSYDQSAEFKSLGSDRSGGPNSGHNVSIDGAETKDNVGAEAVAAEGGKTTAAKEYTTSTNATGASNRGQASRE